MIDGIISLVICYFVNRWFQPYFERYTQYKLSQGYTLEALQSSLDLLWLVIQIAAFIIVYSVVHIIIAKRNK